MPENNAVAELCVITRQAGLGQSLGSGLAVGEFETIEALDAAAPSAEAAILVDLASVPRADDVLRALRRSPRHRFRLIWLRGEASASALALADGTFQAVEDPAARIAECASRLQASAAGRRLQDQDDLLMALLWSHPELTLTAVRDWHAPTLYRYPLLDALLSEGTVEHWLRTLRHRRLLDSVDLIDRVRLCPGCQRAHLSFVDVCPECDALDIRTEPGLHCFSCGHVGPQHQFLTQGMLRCPNCTTVLRHIGEDYDRPLENHVCGSCQHIFVEGNVLARCMGCGQTHKPEALEALAIHTYRLSETGRLAARTGDLGGMYQVFDEINYITPEHFQFFCDWSLELVRRHTDTRFGIVLLRLDRVPELVDQLGHNRATRLVDAFAERLKTLVRSTDLMTRTSEDCLWLFLPQTDRKGVNALADRLRQVQAEAVADSGVDSLGQVVHEVSDAIAPAEDAAALMARLNAQST